jgi:hypothetical protein
MEELSEGIQVEQNKHAGFIISSRCALCMGYKSEQKYVTYKCYKTEFTKMHQNVVFPLPSADGAPAVAL